MVENGDIGEPLEAECVSHFNLNPLIPFGWSHRLEAGGGRLNNNLPHKLSIVEHVLNGHVSAVCGTTRNDMPQAPVVEGVHDFRKQRDFAPKSADEPGLEWGEADAEWSYSLLAQLSSATASQPVNVMFQHGGLSPRFQPDYIAFYGKKGAIYIEGHYGAGPLYYFDRSKDAPSWEKIDLPNRITQAQPDIADDTLRNWAILAQEFVADIGGNGAADYQTFRDGSIYQEVIEAVRAYNNWTDISNE